MNFGRKRVKQSIGGAVAIVLVGLMPPVGSLWSPLAYAKGSAAFCSRPTLRLESEPPPFDVQVRLDKKGVMPGGTVYARLENHGGDIAGYGSSYGLQRRERGRWVEVPVGPFFMPAYALQSGETSRCDAIHVARNAAPGRYRYSKKIRQGGRSESRTLHADFFVRRIPATQS